MVFYEKISNEDADSLLHEHISNIDNIDSEIIVDYIYSLRNSISDDIKYNKWSYIKKNVNSIELVIGYKKYFICEISDDFFVIRTIRNSIWINLKCDGLDGLFQGLNDLLINKTL